MERPAQALYSSKRTLGVLAAKHAKRAKREADDDSSSQSEQSEADSGARADLDQGALPVPLYSDCEAGEAHVLLINPHVGACMRLGHAPECS